MVGVIFKTVQFHLALCVYGGRLVFRLYVFYVSSALNIASCSAWLLVHPLFNLHCKLLKWLPDLNMVMPAPTSCSDLLLSVNICIKPAVSLLSVRRCYRFCGMMPVFDSHVTVNQYFLPSIPFGEPVELRCLLYFYGDGGQSCRYTEGVVGHCAACLCYFDIYKPLYSY